MTSGQIESEPNYVCTGQQVQAVYNIYSAQCTHLEIRADYCQECYEKIRADIADMLKSFKKYFKDFEHTKYYEYLI